MAKDCSRVDPLVTPYVDGELDAGDRDAVDSHNRACPPCRTRVTIEQSVRALLHERQAALKGECAPATLRARCRQSAVGSRQSADSRPSAAVSRAPWRARVMPFALAASLVLIVGAAFLYEATSHSSRLLAAELTADHVKCFAANNLFGIHHETTSSAVGYLAASFGWDAHLPQAADLSLEASRPCLYGEGRVAHLMYRHDGRPVSLFMLPGRTRSDEVVEVMGHEAAIWSINGRTFVLVAHESRDEIRRLASEMRRTVQ